MMTDLKPTSSAAPRSYLTVFFLILLVGFSGAWAYSAFASIYFMDRDYGQWSAKKQMLATCDVGNVALLGDSRASAELIPNLAKPLIVRNLALTGATPIETYFELQKILKCGRPPQTIVLAFSPLQFMELNWYWSHAARYHFLSFPELEDVRRQAKMLHDQSLFKDAFGAEPPPVIKDWLYATSFPPYNFSSVIAAGVGMRRGVNLRYRSETEKNDGQHLEGEAACAHEASVEADAVQFVVNPLIDAYLDRLLATAADHKISVIAVTPPMSAMTINKLKPQFTAEFQKFFIRKFADRHGMASVSPAISQMPDCLYGDDVHLNQRGAETYSHNFPSVIGDAMARLK